MHRGRHLGLHCQTGRHATTALALASLAVSLARALMHRGQVDHTEAIEIDLLLEGIFRVYGYDFRDYARSSLQRRVASCMNDEGVATISAFQDRVLHDAGAMIRLYQVLSVS